MTKLFGAIAILAALFEAWQAWRYFKLIRDHGNKDTPPLVGFGIWGAIVFAVALMAGGIFLLFY
ncbi:hypothetical protein ACFQ4L_01045 [Lapidilactobacillus mulanensis]|uniref:Immunity protein n=1 Tax=Lapidilactobacillus mulanensis TaxID=2485999 RepID=A0ABW4DLA6_9LACO|nr:hypothetical protein [Lapidilactobacillus mulanensis]